VNTLEYRLRAAALAIAEAVPEGSAPPLRLPARRSVVLKVLRRIRALLTPLGAATAVLGAVAVPLTLPGLFQAASGAIAIGPEGTPPYYVKLATDRRQNDIRYAVVGSTATGRPLATVALPGSYVSFTRVTGAADDRTFVLGAQAAGSIAGDQLFLLRYDPARDAAQLSQLPLRSPRGFAPGMLALSPDGGQLAVVDTAPPREEVTVYALATGAMRTWSGANPAAPGAPAFVSWSANGRVVRYGQEGPHRSVYVGLLDPGSPSGPLPPEVRLGLTLPGDVTSLGMSGDGDLLATALKWGTSPGWSITEYPYPVRPRRTHVLSSAFPARVASDPDILWSNATGSTVIVASGTDQVGVISNGLYSALPSAVTNGQMLARAGMAWG
jgi:hypothetical protein